MQPCRARPMSVPDTRQKAGNAMQIFVGLGNPGAKYAGNRHNIGSMALDRIAEEHGFGPWKARFQGQAAEGRLGGGKVLMVAEYISVQLLVTLKWGTAAMLASLMLFGVMALLWIMSRFMKLSSVFGGAAQ